MSQTRRNVVIPKQDLLLNGFISLVWKAAMKLIPKVLDLEYGHNQDITGVTCSTDIRAVQNSEES